MKIKKYILPIALGVLAVFLVSSFLIKPSSVEANKPEFTQVFMTKGGGASTVVRVATTTEGVTYLSATQSASTTFAFSTAGANIVTISGFLTPSTTAATLMMDYQISNDNLPCDSDQNLCNWFSPSLLIQPSLIYAMTAVSSSTILTASTSARFFVNPQLGANATSSFAFQFPTIGAKWMRTRSGVTAAAGALWMEADRAVEILQ